MTLEHLCKASQRDPESTPVLVACEGAVATLTLNRPALLNALNAELAKGMLEALLSAEHDAGVRAVVITGAGAGFMAGGDITMFAKHMDVNPSKRAQDFHTFFAHVHPAITSIKRMPKPVIASVNGACAGFGLSLMMACDLAIGCASSTYTMAYAHMGLSPDGGSSFALPRLVGLRKAMELALLCERFNADTAHTLGLLNRVVEDAVLQEATRQLAQQLASGPTAAFAKTKALFSQSFENTLPQQLQLEEDAFVASTQTHDFPQAVGSFLAKKRPTFEGR